jgi:hypothetical protein
MKGENRPGFGQQQTTHEHRIETTHWRRNRTGDLCRPCDGMSGNADRAMLPGSIRIRVGVNRLRKARERKQN